MIIHQQDDRSGTAIIVVHEIYGLNQHIADFCEKLRGFGYNLFPINLFRENTTYAYTEEKQAYTHFMEQVGFQSSAKRIREAALALRESYARIIAIGFSVGATSAWIANGEQGICDIVIGFYGSRIRDYLEIEPTSPTLLIFPEQEKSFEVKKLVTQLNSIPNVDVHVFAGEHGFADPYSKHYCEESAKRAFEEMLKFISVHV